MMVNVENKEEVEDMLRKHRHSSSASFVQSLKDRHPHNHLCFDCAEPNPEWVSLGFGIYICLDCAGYHRSLGVHITMVRAIRLDSWTAEHSASLEHGGNEAFLHHLHSIHIHPHPIKSDFGKYENPRVLYYT